MKATYDYDSKSKARTALKTVVGAIYPKRKSRKKLKVLTLLGHESHELSQIWDPLGIPRENITVVEGHRDAYEMIRSQNLGVDLVKEPISFLDYLNGLSLGTSFDVINYDSVSPFGFEQREILRYIAGGGFLGKKGILSAAFLGKREHGYTKEWFREQLKLHGDRIGSTEKEGLKSRSDLISRMICAIFMDGRCTYEVHPLLLRDSKLLERYHEKTKSLKEKNNVPENHIIWDNSETVGILKELIKERIARDRPNLSEEILYVLSNVIFYQGTGSYQSALQRRVKYVGDNGSPMLVDINFFKQENAPKDFYLEFDPCIEDFRFIEPHPLVRKECKKPLDDFLKARYRCQGDTLAEREYLGSSAKPILTKSKALEEFRQGLSIEEIKQKYRSVENKPLAQWKAHMTMGTYDKDKRKKDEEVIEHCEDSDLEKITKEDAIDFIESGIPIEEVHAAYPTSFSLGQLKAYKAHITMGTYRERKTA